MVTEVAPSRFAGLTHCPYCAMQCGMAVVKDGEGWTVASRDFPSNRGGLCRKGWTAATLLNSPERLMTPLIRTSKGGKLRPASWDEALDQVVIKFKSIVERSGPNAIGVFGGGGLTNEKAYMLGKFARVALRTANIDYNGRFCMASAAAAGQRVFGLDRGMPFPMADIAKTQAIMMIGGNPVETWPVIMQYFEVQRAAGGAFIVVDPRRTETAKLATLHLQLTPGTDSALANGILHVAIQHGLIDRDFIDSRTTGFEAVRRLVSSYWPDRVERMTGVPARQIERTAHILGEAATAMLLTGRGPEQQSHGVNNVLAFINLILALGKAGKQFCGYATLTGQGNGQGGREHGQKTDQLPGYRRLDNPRHRSEVAAIWGIDAAELPKPGLTACELLDSAGADGGIEGLLVMGSNVVVAAPASVPLIERLAKLDLLVVADLFLSETAAIADVVLPVAQWAEEEGTMTSLEGRIILRRRVKAPPEGVWTDNQVLKALADRLGRGDRFTANTREIFDELRLATAGAVADYSGVSYERIDAEDGVFWPCPSPDHPGTPRLFLDRFATEDGRARFHAVEHRASAEIPDKLFPYFLTTGRVLVQYNSGTQTRRNPELREAAPEPFVEIHPETAQTLSIGDGDIVTLTTRRGRAVMKARLTRDIRLDTLFVPFHWGGRGSANALTIGALDPVSRIPEFKVCAAQVEKITAPMESSLESITTSYLN
jgi:assimilatory nitrate reductase catalytic subunit